MIDLNTNNKPMKGLQMSEPNGGQFCYITFFTARRLRAYLDLLCFATRTQRKSPYSAGPLYFHLSESIATT